MSARTYPKIADGLPAPVRPISFVCVQFCDEYHHNILTSQAVQDPMNQFIRVDNRQNLFFNTLSAAINHGVAQARHDLIAIVHEDVVLPKNWHARFEASLRDLEEHDPNWAMLGAVGWQDKTVHGHWSDPHKYLNTFTQANFNPIGRLDEQLLIVRKDGPVQFDSNLPSIHNIGRDLARSGRKRGLKSYALNAPTIHKYADSAGKLVQSAKDSVKIKNRKTRTYLADRACSDAYLDHKWASQTAAGPLQISADQQAILDAPTLLVGRGGGGTRVLSMVAQDCGLFIGNNVSDQGDTIDMVSAIYTAVFQQHQSRNPWLQAQSVPLLRAAASAMMETAGWPKNWGFKLPEALLILPQIQEAFPKARYIELSQTPDMATRRRTHMTARLDNEIGRTALRLAYDNFSLPRANILTDKDQSRMVVTTLHQNGLAKKHLHHLPENRFLELRFQDVVKQSEHSIARFSEFTGLEIQSNKTVGAIDKKRAFVATPDLDPDEHVRATDLLGRLRNFTHQWNRIATASPVLILGMHRSGTSGLTGALEAAGLFLGETRLWSDDNRKGNREHSTAMALNTDVLAANKGNWKAPSQISPLHWSQDLCNRRNILLADFAASAHWGLKDPRLIFTLEGWQDVLPNARMVGIFRHPVSVAKSLEARKDLSFQEGLDLWKIYNRRLLQLHDATPFPLIDFDQPTQAYLASVKALCAALNLPNPDASSDFFDPELKHFTPPQTPLDDPELVEIYAELQRRFASGRPGNPAAQSRSIITRLRARARTIAKAARTLMKE